MANDNRKRIILDTDPGMDDALAFFFALAHPEIQVEAITVVAGNVGLHHTLNNALRLLELADRTDVPVAAGAYRPLVRTLNDAADVHGANGLNGLVLPKGSKEPIDTHAVDLILELSHRYPGEITLVALGPLTNVAMAILKDPGVATRLKEIILMGGACFTHGNTNAAAEFNIWCDPEAAKVVYESGARIIQVGLDVTHQVRLTRAHVQEMKRRSPGPITEFIDALYEPYFQRMAAYGQEYMHMHDPLTVGVVVAPDLVETQFLHVDIEVQSPLSLGMTLAERRPWREGRPAPNVHVCTKVDGERFIQLYMDTVTK